jgi:hypothetical protein
MFENKFTGPHRVLTDEYADNRMDYSFKSKFNLGDVKNNKHGASVLYWENHEGTKSVRLELNSKDETTDLMFTLLDYRYCVLAS